MPATETQIVEVDTTQSPPEMVEVELFAIDLERSPQMRDGYDEEYIKELAAVYAQAPRDMRAPWVCDCGAVLLLVADGMHRIKAAAQVGYRRLTCRIFHCSEDACYLLAGTQNRMHGQRLTNLDKVKRADTFLQRWPRWSDGRLAEKTGVSETTIATRRHYLEGNGLIPCVVRREGLDGKTRDLPTTPKGGGLKSHMDENKPLIKSNPKQETNVTGKAPCLPPLPPPPAPVEMTRQEMDRHLGIAEKLLTGLYRHGDTAVLAAIEEVRAVRGACQLELPGIPPAEAPKGKGTREEVNKFFAELKLEARDAEWFFCKCQGNGWKVDGKAIRDWKMTVRSWKIAGIFPSQKASPSGETPAKHVDPALAEAHRVLDYVRANKGK